METNEKNTYTPAVQGWKDIHLTGELPLNALVDFFNVLNQRLAQLEDLVRIEDENKSLITLTEFYRRRTEEELKKQVEEDAKTKGE